MNITIGFYNIFFWLLLVGAAWCAWQISVTDWRRRIIPDVYLFPLLLIGLIITTFFPWPTNIAESVIAATAGYILAALIGFIFEKINKKHKKSDTPIGMGDIKLIAVGGIWLGATGMAGALIIACLTGMLWGRRNQQQFIPFAPFFVAGGILSLITMILLV